MSGEPTNQQKRREILSMLERGVVMVHLDPRAIGVVVPPRFRSDAVLRLNLAYGYKLPALEITDEGVFAVLSFDQRNFGCTLPWEAIFALTMPDDEHSGMVWPDSVPAELWPAFQESNERSEGFEGPPPAVEKPRLRVVDGGGGASASGGRPRPRLRLVKE